MTDHFNKKELKERRRQLRGDMTYCEKLMWTHLRKRQMGVRILRQFSIDAYVIDFYSPEIRFAIELDGDVHESVDQKEYDGVRQKYIESFGIYVMRVSNEELMENPNKTFDKIQRKINELQKLKAEEENSTFPNPSSVS